MLTQLPRRLLGRIIDDAARICGHLHACSMDGWVSSASPAVQRVRLSLASAARHLSTQYMYRYVLGNDTQVELESFVTHVRRVLWYLHDLDGRYSPPFPPILSPAATGPLPSPFFPNDGLADAAAPDMEMQTQTSSPQTTPWLQLNRLDSLPSLPSLPLCALQPPCPAGAMRVHAPPSLSRPLQLTEQPATRPNEVFLAGPAPGVPRHTSSSGCFVVVGRFVVVGAAREPEVDQADQADPWSHHGRACKSLQEPARACNSHPALGPSRLAPRFPAPNPTSSCTVRTYQHPHPRLTWAPMHTPPPNTFPPTPPRPSPNLHPLPSVFSPCE